MQCFKTRFCAFHLQGRCARGEDCTFAHHESEMRLQPDLSKTKLCVEWRRGRCSNSNCTYAHGLEELKSDKVCFKTSMCSKWQVKGGCMNASCPYAHSVAELRTLRLAEYNLLVSRTDEGTHDVSATYKRTDDKLQPSLKKEEIERIQSREGCESMIIEGEDDKHMRLESFSTMDEESTTTSISNRWKNCSPCGSFDDQTKTSLDMPCFIVEDSRPRKVIGLPSIPFLLANDFQGQQQQVSRNEEDALCLRDEKASEHEGMKDASDILNKSKNYEGKSDTNVHKGDRVHVIASDSSKAGVVCAKRYPIATLPEERTVEKSSPFTSTLLPFMNCCGNSSTNNLHRFPRYTTLPGLLTKGEITSGVGAGNNNTNNNTNKSSAWQLRGVATANESYLDVIARLALTPSFAIEVLKDALPGEYHD